MLPTPESPTILNWQQLAGNYHMDITSMFNAYTPLFVYQPLK